MFQQVIPMNRILPILLLAVFLLGGCGKPADRPATSVPASATGGGTAPLPATVAADAAPAATNGSVEAPPVDDDTAVNASIDRVLGDHARYQGVIKAYQKAVGDGDKTAVAALVDYPIKVDIDGSKTTVGDPAAFVRDYDKIITPAIAGAIEAQKYSELMVNGQGVMFGSGETWINGVCKKGSADCSEFEVKVVAIQAGASN
jgi:hypothetical protein